MVYRSTSQTKYNIHHIKPVEDGGDVYNLDNLEIVAPKTHDEIHAEIDEQNRVSSCKKTNKKQLRLGGVVICLRI